MVFRYAKELLSAMTWASEAEEEAFKLLSSDGSMLELLRHIHIWDMGGREGMMSLDIKVHFCEIRVLDHVFCCQAGVLR